MDKSKLLQNISLPAMTDREQLNKAIRVASSHISLGSKSTITINQGQVGSYYFYASNGSNDYPSPEWTWLLLFGFVIIVVLMVVAIVAVQNCCSIEEEEDDNDASEYIQVKEDIEIQDCPKERRKPKRRYRYIKQGLMISSDDDHYGRRALPCTVRLLFYFSFAENYALTKVYESMDTVPANRLYLSVSLTK